MTTVSSEIIFTSILGNSQRKNGIIYFLQQEIKPSGPNPSGVEDMSHYGWTVKAHTLWQTIDLATYVAGFPHHQLSKTPCNPNVVDKAMWFEFNRAGSMIGVRNRRGRGNVLYMRPDTITDQGLLAYLNGETHYTKYKVDPLDTRYKTIHYVDFVPEGYVLMMYESASCIDVGFVYDEARGVCTQPNDRDFGILIKI